MSKFNGIEFSSTQNYVRSISTVLDGYDNAKIEYLKNNTITKEQIEHEALVEGVDLKRHPEQYDHVKEICSIELENRANRAKIDYAKEHWNAGSVRPETSDWCVALTSLWSIRICYYDKKEHKWTDHQGYDSSNYHQMGGFYEKVEYWTPITYDKLKGKIINGVSYVNFPEHRFKEDGTIEIFPLDKCHYRTTHEDEHNPYLQDYPLQQSGNTYTKAGFEQRQCNNKLIEVVLVDVDEDDEIYYKIKREKEEAERLLREEEERKRKEREEEEKRQKEEERRRKEQLEAQYRQEYQRQLKNTLDTGIVDNTYQFASNIKKDLYKVTEGEINKFKDILTNAGADDIDLFKGLNAYKNILIKKSTGKTTRIVNQIIEDFFNKPIGTPILIADHYTDNRYIIELVKKTILNGGFPKSGFNIRYVGKVCYLYRTEQTLMEKSQDTLSKICDKYKIDIEKIMEDK